MVSVVIPSYNYGRFIGSTIESVLRQSYTGFELIVVDDGSADDTRRVVEAVQDERVRYIYQTNAGLSAARNTGIKNARFDHIAFLDADDEWLPEMLESVMEQFKILPSGFGLLATASVHMDSSGNHRQSKTYAHEADHEITIRDLILKNRFMPSATVVRKQVFDECGTFDTTLRSSEDRDMWIRIAKHYRIHFISKPLVLIRKHPNNMSKHATRMKKNTFAVLRRAYQNGMVSRWNFLFWLCVMGVFYFETAWTHYDEGRRAAAFFYLLASLLVWPGWLNAAPLNEPPFFRLRAFIHFIFGGAQARWRDRLFPRQSINPKHI